MSFDTHIEHICHHEYKFDFRNDTYDSSMRAYDQVKRTWKQICKKPPGTTRPTSGIWIPEIVPTCRRKSS